MKKIYFGLLMAIALATGGDTADIIPGQFVSWSDFSYVTTIAVGQEYAYFGTTEGIMLFDRYLDRWDDPITESDGLGSGMINRIAVSFDDQVLSVETEAGIYTLDRAIGKWYFDTDFPFEDYRDSRPKPPLPLLFMPVGYRMDPDGLVQDNYFRRFEITAWLEDNFNNNIYAGTWGLGPLLVNGRNLEAEIEPGGLLQKQTDAIYIEGDSIWLAGNAGRRRPEHEYFRLGVTLYDRQDRSFRHFEPRMLTGFDSEIIYDIAGDRKNIYFAGQQGLTILKRGDDYFYTLNRRDGLPDTKTTALTVAGDSVWIGTARGLSLYTPSVDTLVTVGGKLLRERFITDLEIAEDRLIIGTDRGAYYIDIASKKIGRLRDSEGNLAGTIRHICYFEDELFISTDWALTRINLNNERAEQVPYSDRPGGVFSAAANEKYIAAATGEGLILIERETKRKRTFTELDGLLSVNISVMVPEGDSLWIGSDQGLTRFLWVNPERVD